MSKIQTLNFPSISLFMGRLRRKMLCPGKSGGLGAILFLLVVQVAVVYATDWETVPIIQHRDYQAIKEYPVGSGKWVSDFSGPLPFRLVGVVLNDTEDWLDPTAHYTATYTPGFLGGQAEIFVQAVNLDGTDWDPDPEASFQDFGGTACWMGQNYGNLPWKHDPELSYTDEEWYSELNRLQLWHPEESGLPPPPEQQLRKGDLVEIRTVVGGLYYSGKMNVNEQHNNDPSYNFETVVLQRNYGLPTAAQLTLSDLKNADNTFIFDSTRATGGEHYQMSLVELQNVQLKNPLLWGPNMDLALTDATGREFNVHLGLDAGFYTYMAPTTINNVTGVIDQASSNGRDGYRLLTLEAAQFSALSSVAAPVWNGGGGSDTRWSVAANWSGPSPIDGWELHFGANAGGNSVNDFSNNTAFAGIVFNPNAAAFTLTGNAVKVARAANFSSVAQTIDLTLTTDDANCVLITATGNILVSQPIVGSHGLEKYGAGDLILTATNTYTGTTDIEAGLLKLCSGGRIDSSSAIEICSGATLKIEGGEHQLAAIAGVGNMKIYDSAQVVVEAISAGSLYIGLGCKLTIAGAFGGAPYACQDAQTVPEPSVILLLTLGMLGLAAYGVFQRR